MSNTIDDENLILEATPYFNEVFWKEYLNKTCTILVKTFRRPKTLFNTINTIFSTFIR